ncbi:hypothetical protein I6F14_23150 [Bradyrhizobium sp. IC3069]|nr:hypothetical protein [Bradyrhizobium sp. IC4059]MCA1520876.1 hypothetical protein [Bradyrhizobium sp. IC3069]
MPKAASFSMRWILRSPRQFWTTRLGPSYSRGRGDHFSAGHDLKEAQNFTVEQRYAYEEKRYFDYALRIWGCPKPTITSVQGACVAGGFMVAQHVRHGCGF